MFLEGKVHYTRMYPCVTKEKIFIIQYYIDVPKILFIVLLEETRVKILTKNPNYEHEPSS